MAWHWAKIEEVNSIMGIDFYVKLISHLSRQLLDSHTVGLRKKKSERNKKIFAR